MIAASYCAKGAERSVCQDTCVLEVMEHKHRKDVLMVVCDGIGGLQQGEYASQFVARHIKTWFYESYPKYGKRWITRKCRKEMLNSCTRMLYGCHTTLNQYGVHNHIKLGTTMSMILLIGKQFYLFHVGDSRAYLIGRHPGCITRDDVYKYNVLSKCIGSFPWQGITIVKGTVKKGQGLMICSDGIYKAFSEEELVSTFSKSEFMTEKQLKKRIITLSQEAAQRGLVDDQACTVIFFRRRK